MKRREFLLSIAAAGTVVLAAPAASAAGEPMVVYKDPNCGCCHAWAEAMKTAGFSVEIRDVDDLDAIKRGFAISANMQACHTATVAGYYVEGHVPVDAVTRLLS